MIARCGPFSRDDRGAAGAEMALMLPIMLALFFVSFEAGHYFYTEHKIVKSVRQGARYAGRLPFDTYSCPAGIDPAAVSQIQAVTRTGSLDGTVPLIAGWENSDITVTMTCESTTTTGIFQSNTGGAPVVTVAATASYPSLFGTLTDIDNDAQVVASAQAVVNGI